MREQNLTRSVLPSNTTQMERALEGTFVQELDIEVAIKHIWDPWKCPAHMLSWLARNLSVDEFSSTWPEDIQRQVIADSVPTHLQKGTLGAVKNALAALDAVVEVSRWYEHGGVPFTARITAWAGNNLDPDGNTMLTPRLQAQIWRVVAATKPRTTRVEFQVGLRFDQEMHVTAATTCHDITRSTAQSTTDVPPLEAEHYLAAVSKTHDVYETQLSAEADKVNTSTMFVAATGHNIVINRTVMECL